MMSTEHYSRCWRFDLHTHGWTNTTQGLYKVLGLLRVTTEEYDQPVSQTDGRNEAFTTHVPRPVSIFLFIMEL